MPSRKQKHRIENYLADCWRTPICKYYQAQEVRATRPTTDPPDVDFRVIHGDGSETLTWGEITGSYYNNDEAKWMWGDPPDSSTFYYFQPDRSISEFVAKSLKGKLKKYSLLTEARGKGHLLIFLHSKLTTRSTRIRAARSLIETLVTDLSSTLPFESIWLSYRLPNTEPDEMEDSSFCFRDEDGRLNFFKRIRIPRFR